MISNDQMEKALNYLGQTDEQAAQAKGNLERLNKIEKTILGAEFLEATGKSNQEKESIARTSTAYREWMAEYESAVYEYEIIRNKRTRAELTIEVWRSINANRRRGNL